MKKNRSLIESISLIKRMDSHMTLTEAEEYVDKLKEQEISFTNSDDIFNLDSIPMEVLDNAWKRYHPFLFSIDHRHPLSNNLLEEGTDYRKQLEFIKDVITNTFPIPQENFVIKEGNHGLFAAILIALTDDNLDVIEDAMEKKRFFRSQPTDEKLLTDRKKRKWLDVRFEPMDPDDVTEDIHRLYGYLYHLAPSKFEKEIKDNGLLVSNRNSEFRYSEERVFFMEGDVSDKDIQALVNTLYAQSLKKNIEGLTPSYTLFKFDLNKLESNFRFFYDINEPKGIYTKSNVPPSAIVEMKTIIAKTSSLLQLNNL